MSETGIKSEVLGKPVTRAAGGAGFTSRLQLQPHRRTEQRYSLALDLIPEPGAIQLMLEQDTADLGRLVIY